MNNPIMYVDPDGEFAISIFVASIAVGFLIGGLGSLVSEGLTNGWNNINWGKVAFDAVIGGISGAVGGSAIGVFGSIVGGAALGSVGSVGGDLIMNNGDFNKVNWRNAGINAIIGGFCGAISGGGIQNQNRMVGKLFKNNNLKSQFGRLENAVKNYMNGSISKRGMQGVFNLYGKKFSETLATEMASVLAMDMAINVFMMTSEKAFVEIGDYLWW